ncbi:MAG: ABC transporter permease [Acidimicrobiales bacterium]
MLATVTGSPVGVQAGKMWRHPRYGGVVRAIVGFLLLYGSLRVFLRNNVPPGGVIVFGAIIGLLYSLVAFGLILIYRANRIINFAQAEMGAAPAVFAVLLIKVHHVPYLVALPIALVAGLLAGFIIEVLVVRRFFKAPRLVLSVVTIGVALVFALIQFYLPKWVGGRALIDPKPPRTPFSGLSFTIAPVKFDANAIVIIFAAALVVVGLTLFFKLTDVGIAVRASAENAERATLLGISVKSLSTIVWMLGTALSTLGVFLRIPVIGLPIGADVGTSVLLYALAAAVIARMESFPVALAAGVAIGILDQSLYYFSRDPNIGVALMLPVLLVAMLAQRQKLSRGQDSGQSSFKQASEFRPIPPELRAVPEVVWSRFVLGALGLAAVLALPYLVGLKQQILSSVIIIYAMVAVSLVILTGWAGQISLGQWGISGVGAVVAGGMAAHLHADFFLTLVLAGLAGAAASVLIGIPALRIQGLYLAVTTLAFAAAVQVYLLSPIYFKSFLPNTIQDIRRPLLYGRYSIDGPRAFYYVCLLFLALCLSSARALRRSRAGRVIIAARDNERGAQSYGVSVQRARLAAFAISGFWAALAGALFAYQQKVLDNGSFDPSVSFLLLIIVVIGGVTSLPGAMLGAFYIGALKYGNFSPQIQALASAVGVLILLYVLPGGLAQLFYQVRDNGLRFVAERKGLLVPSLLADQRDEDGEQAPELVSPTSTLTGAPALTAPENVSLLQQTGHADQPAVVCPSCGEHIALSEISAHEHFEVVPT